MWPLGVLKRPTTPTEFFGMVFATTFDGSSGGAALSPITDTTGRHNAIVIRDSTSGGSSGIYSAAADGFGDIGGGDKTLYIFNTGSNPRDRLAISATYHTDFVFNGDMSFQFLALSENTASTEVVLACLSNSQAPALGANQYNNLTIRYTNSGKSLRLYAGTTLIASGTLPGAGLQATAGTVRVERVGSELKLKFNGTQVGSTVTYSGTIGGGICLIGGFSNTLINAKSMYFDLVEINKNS